MLRPVREARVVKAVPVCSNGCGLDWCDAYDANDRANVCWGDILPRSDYRGERLDGPEPEWTHLCEGHRDFTDDRIEVYKRPTPADDTYDDR